MWFNYMKFKKFIIITFIKYMEFRVHRRSMKQVRIWLKSDGDAPTFHEDKDKKIEHFILNGADYNITYTTLGKCYTTKYQNVFK